MHDQALSVPSLEIASAIPPIVEPTLATVALAANEGHCCSRLAGWIGLRDVLHTQIVKCISFADLVLRCLPVKLYQAIYICRHTYPYRLYI